jgi:hypothetical protein
MKRNIISNRSQDGAALIITIVVLLALTVLALAATNSNQSQTLMVRNSQFRFDSFNASYTEIDGQVEAINLRDISLGVPDYLLVLIDGAIQGIIRSPGTAEADTAAGELPTYVGTDAAYVTQTVDQQYQGICRPLGQQVGSGAEKIKCDELRIIVGSTKTNTQISSVQNQVYEYLSLAE